MSNPPEKPFMERAKEFARYHWENRGKLPSFHELYYIYIPLGAAVVGTAVGIVDGVFDLHIAEAMANVQVDPNDNVVERFFEGLVHQIGAAGVKLEHQK